MPRLKYKLDDLLKRVRVREEIRSIGNPQFMYFHRKWLSRMKHR